MALKLPSYLVSRLGLRVLDLVGRCGLLLLDRLDLGPLFPGMHSPDVLLHLVLPLELLAAVVAAELTHVRVPETEQGGYRERDQKATTMGTAIEISIALFLNLKPRPRERCPWLVIRLHKMKTQHWMAVFILHES